jgi:hypothetical protein
MVEIYHRKNKMIKRWRFKARTTAYIKAKTRSTQVAKSHMQY